MMARQSRGHGSYFVLTAAEGGNVGDIIHVGLSWPGFAFVINGESPQGKNYLLIWLVDWININMHTSFIGKACA